MVQILAINLNKEYIFTCDSDQKLTSHENIRAIRIATLLSGEIDSPADLQKMQIY